MNHPEWAGDLTDAQRATAFGNGENQLGLSICRVFVNDNSNQWNRALATAKYAQSNGAIVFASPWNPPSSMTETFSKQGDADAKRLKKSSYGAYADHLNNFVKYMKNNGVDLYAISIQNEPDWGFDWTWWTEDECVDFLAICQCEYGQSRSAATAAAILEHFYHNGISVFTNYNYYPNQVVYHKTFDALEQYRRYHDNRYYYAADTDVIKKHIEQLGFSDTLFADYNPENSHSVVDFKFEAERQWSEQHQLYTTPEEIINALRKDNQPVYASFTVSKLFYLYFGWNPDGIGTYFRYGCEEIPVYIYFNRYYFNTSDYKLPLHLRKSKNITFSLGSRGNFKSLSFFGKLSWDSERKMIDAIPLIITNMQA